MRRLALLLPCALTACATSLAGLGEKEPRFTLDSAKPAEEVATCLVTSLNWSNDLMRMAPGHFVIVRNDNTYKIPMIRWDIKDTPGGSRIELRATAPFGEGADKARACA